MLNFRYYFFLLFILYSFTCHKTWAQLNPEQQELITQYNQKIKDYKANGQFKEAAIYLNKRAFIYLGGERYEEAIHSYIESTELNNRIGNDADNKKIYNNIAMIYAELNQMNNSIKYFEKSLMISRRNNNKNEIAISLMDISTIMIYNKEYEKAIKYLDEALKLSNDQDNLNALISCYDLLAQAHKANGNIKKSNEYYEQYLVLDKLRNEGKISLSNKSKDFISAESQSLNKNIPEDKTGNLNPESEKNEKLLSSKKESNIKIPNHIPKIEEITGDSEKEIQKGDNQNEIISLKTELIQKDQTIMFFYLVFISVTVIFSGLTIYLLWTKNRKIKILKQKLEKFENSEIL